MKYICDGCEKYPCDDTGIKLMKYCPAYSPKPKPKSNADRIRAMTDEEIENWFWWMHKEMMRYTDSRVFLHDWLRQEVNDGRN